MTDKKTGAACPPSLSGSMCTLWHGCVLLALAAAEMLYLEALQASRDTVGYRHPQTEEISKKLETIKKELEKK